MKRSLVLALCLISTVPARAANPAKLTSLSGIVVKQPGDQPLKKVLLNLIAESQPGGGTYTTETDQDGHFQFDDVQPGRYRLLLEKTGFHAINIRGHRSEGPVLSLQAGQKITDQVFEMLQSAIITGKVVDEDGEPLPNFGMSLLKRRPGKLSRLELVAEERTNDLGDYRFAGLFPGQYFVAVVPPPDIRNFTHSVEKPESAGRRDLAYLPTYYPGTSDGTQATPIDLHAGNELPINFSLVPSNSYRIRGIVTGIPANQKPLVQLISRGVIQTINGGDVKPDGRFEIRGVAPGSYYVTVFGVAEGQTLSAREPVSVVAADVEGLKLVPVRPFSVSGRVRFEDFYPKNVTHCSVYLRPATDPEDDNVALLGAGASTQLDAMGNFQWSGVLPGNYTVQFTADGDRNVFVKAVLIGQNSFTTGFELTGPASLELVLSGSAGSLEGVVLDGEKPAASISVVAVPEEKFRKLDDRFRTTTTDQYGRFTMKGLVPGTYSVFAWQDLDDDLYQDPAFLKSQDGNGTSVKVGEGSRERVELKLSPVGEEWQ